MKLYTTFIRAITMIVIPLVVASLMVGVATLGDLRELGRIGGKTLGYYLCTTAIAVSIGVVLSNLIEPGARIPEESKAALLEAYGGEAEGRIELAQEAPGLRNLLLSLISDNPVQSAAQGDMLPLALVVKFLARLRLGDFYRRIREAQILAFSTSSSNATLPVTIKVAEGELGD
jgi:Na+/H+-dicarboxylate symporter